MLNFSDKSNPLIERVKSPLYGSFIITWIIWNWRIFITLAFFDKEDYKGLNVVEYVITNYLDWWNSLLIPLGITLLYVFALPFPDYWTLMFTEERRRKKIDKKIETGRKHFVEGNHYYDLRLKYNEEKKRLTDIEEELLKAKAELEDSKDKLVKEDLKYKQLNIDFDESKMQYRETNAKLNNLVNRKSPGRYFNGRWTFKRVDKELTQGKFNDQEIEVKDFQGFLVENNDEQKLFVIDFVDFDEDNKKFHFIKHDQNTKKIIVCRLEMKSRNRLEGTEDKLHVTYIRNSFELDSHEGMSVGIK